MIKDVKKRAFWRDSWKGKVSLWISDNLAFLVIFVVLVICGVCRERDFVSREAVEK